MFNFIRDDNPLIKQGLVGYRGWGQKEAEEDYQKTGGQGKEDRSPYSVFSDSFGGFTDPLRGASISSLWDKYVSPLDKKYGISQMFGNVNEALYKGITKGAKHLGVDLKTPEGTEVKAPFSGYVRFGSDPRGFGDYAELVNPETGESVRFSHLSAMNRALNGFVQAGQPLGKTGGRPGTQGAGNTTGAHLDISARRNGQYIDPMTLEYLRQFLS